MSETARREVTLLGKTVPYEVRRSQEATKPRIDVDIDGVRVVVPDQSTADPEELLLENGNWVVEKRSKFERFRDQIPDRAFEEGETFPYQGEPHEIVIESRSASQVVDGEFRLAEHHVEQTSVKRALESLYRRKAREWFERRADHHSERMGIEYEKIEIRNQRTKWGSCSSNGTLGLNWRLMMAPSEVANYIVVHELAHLREPNHSDAFWSLVAEYEPNYENLGEWLKQNSAKLIFSNEDL
jgi:predicted metal-dependent hydrolase